MRIRRHLFFYNTISVLVALVAMLAVNSAATHAIGRYPPVWFRYNPLLRSNGLWKPPALFPRVPRT